MAYSAGASNVANAVGLIVGSGTLQMDTAVVFASATIGLGAFTIATRTIETTGTGITNLSLLGTLIVEITNASIIAILSVNGIPASLAVTATMCVIGLGWGRASRQYSLDNSAPDVLNRNGEIIYSDDSEDTATNRLSLFNSRMTVRIIVLWVLAPMLAGIGAYCIFGPFSWMVSLLAR